MKKSKNFIYDLIIIGAGPAGASAAINARDRVRAILVIEKGAIGGKIAKKESVTNHLGFENISGKDFSDRVAKQLACREIDLVKHDVTSVGKFDNLFKVTTNLETFTALSVINATGSRERELGVSGEDKEGVSYWLPQNIELLKKKEVAVVGGGHAACENAIRLSKVAKKVYIINLKDNLNCDNKLADLINKEEVIEILPRSSVVAIEGDSKVNCLLIKSTSYPVRKIAVENVIICIGWIPNSALVSGLSVTDHANYVRVNPDRSTKTDGLFSIGDTLKKRAWNIANAIADGAIAAQSATLYLERIAKK